MKCCQNKNFEEMDTQFSTGKNAGFDYREEYSKIILNKILLWQY